MSRKIFGAVWGYLSKYEKPKGKKQKLATAVTSLILLVLLFMVWGCPPANLVGIWGRSLQPTAKVISIPEPLAFLSFSGWLHYDRKAERSVGKIVYFQVPKSRDKEGKRIAKERKVAGKKEFWLEPDSNVSGEGSGFGRYDWVSEDYILGVADQILTPGRLLQGTTRRGRFHNWVELNVFRTSPSRELMWHWSGEKVAFVRGDHFSIYQAEGSGDGKVTFQSKFQSTYNRTCFWMGDSFVFPADGVYSFRQWTENSPLKEIVIKPCTPKYASVTILPEHLLSPTREESSLDLKSWLTAHAGNVVATQAEGLDASKLFDGDTLTNWGPLPADPTGRTSSITLDLGQKCPDVVGVELVGLNSGESFKVVVQSSEDGLKWKSALAQQSLTTMDTPSLWMTAPVEPVRYYKLKVTALKWTMTGSIGEFRLLR